jgi:hypothetical protein
VAFAEEGRGTGRLWGRWAIPLGLLLLILVSWGFSTHYLPLMRFTSEGWRHGGGENGSKPVRLQMIEWLTRSGQLDGLTRPQVAALLGPADRPPYFREWDLVYLLGPERGMFSIDSEWLVIRFGPNGRVADYRVVSD